MGWLRWVAERYPHHAEPDGDVLLPHHFYLGVIASTYGFLFLWPRYPTLGSTVAIAGLLIALDDVVQHAFGVWTPLDAGWKFVLTRLAPDWFARSD